MIGVLMLNTRFPRWPGDIGNASSFEHPVLYDTIPAAVVDTIVKDAKPERQIVGSFIESGIKLADQGATVIGTSCGFMASVQNEIAEKLPVPFISSSLILLPILKSLFGQGAQIGVLTFDSNRLGQCHFPDSIPVDDPTISVSGLDHDCHWFQCINNNLEQADKVQARVDVFNLVESCLQKNPDIAAILLECTNLSPWKTEIQSKFKRPVFDLVSALEWVYRSTRI